MSTSRAQRHRTTRSSPTPPTTPRHRVIVTNVAGKVLSNEAVRRSLRTTNPHGQYHATGSRHSLQWRQRHQLCGHGDGPAERYAASERLHLACRFPSRSVLDTSTRSSRRRRARRTSRLQFRRWDPKPTSCIAWSSRFAICRAEHTIRDVLPRTVSLTIATNPAGLQRARGAADGDAADFPKRRRDCPWARRAGHAAVRRTTLPVRVLVRRRRPITTSPRRRRTRLIQRPIGRDRRHREWAFGDRLDNSISRGPLYGRRSDGRLRVGRGIAVSLDRERYVQRPPGRPGLGVVHGVQYFVTVSDDGVRLWVNGQ